MICLRPILARWSGPFSEGQTTPVRKHVQDIIYIPPKASALDNNNIKSAIMNYGAISASFYWSSGYLRTGGYYYPSGGSGNHMITIVGWDDNHAVSGAPGNGAYICKNSWGSSWNGDGYFWVSYYDGIMGKEDVAVFNDADPVTTYDTIYQYDPLGWTTNYGYGSNYRLGGQHLHGKHQPGDRCSQLLHDRPEHCLRGLCLH